MNDANFGYGPDDGNSGGGGGGGNTDGNGVISGQIWGDDDSDGTLNNAEAGLEGVDVNLVTSVGSFVDSTTTDTNGDFSFTGLAGGDYIVGVVTSSPALSGTKATFDRDSDTAGLGNQAAITLVDDDDVVNDANFGYGPDDGNSGGGGGGGSNDGNGVISGQIWSDSNSNAVLDGAEAGISNVTVNLVTSAGSFVASAPTNGTGHYDFTGLAAGDYIVGIDPNSLPTGLTPTYDRDSDTVGLGNQTAITLATDTDIVNDADFGYGPDDGSGGSGGGGGGSNDGNGEIGGRLWLDDNGDGVQDADEPSIFGVTVNLVTSAGSFIGNAETDYTGAFNFTGLAAGDYIVGVDPATVPNGFVQTFDRDAGTVGLGNQAALTLASDTDTITDADFGYTPSDTGTPGANQATIGGRVWADENADGVQDAAEVGLEGLTINLTLPDGSFVRSDVTDSNGTYQFDNLDPGDYMVGIKGRTIPTDAVQTFASDGTLDNAVDVTVAAAEQALNADMGYDLP